MGQGQIDSSLEVFSFASKNTSKNFARSTRAGSLKLPFIDY